MSTIYLVVSTDNGPRNSFDDSRSNDVEQIVGVFTVKERAVEMVKTLRKAGKSAKQWAPDIGIRTVVSDLEGRVTYNEIE